MLIEVHTPDEFSIEEYKYIKYFNELNGLEDKRKISRILRGIQECIQLFKKWSLENNMILLKESYPALIQDKARVRNLLDYNSQSSYTAAKIEFNKTMEEIKRDLEELKRKKIILSNLFGNREFIGNRKEAGIYTYIMTKLNTLQSGGNISLQTILLPPNTDSKYINDAESNFYSVIDSYLVTKIHATFFREYFNIKYPSVAINLSLISSEFEAGDLVSRITLAKKGLIKNDILKIKVIGGTKDFSKKIDFDGIKFSASTKKIVEKAGCTIK